MYYKLAVLLIALCFVACLDDITGSEYEENILSVHGVTRHVSIGSYPTISETDVRTLKKIDRVQYLEDGEVTGEEFRFYVIKDQENLEVFLSSANVTSFCTGEVGVSTISNILYELTLGHNSTGTPVYEYALYSLEENELKAIWDYLNE